nr:unnamed protein product [Callosobruchus analis]
METHAKCKKNYNTNTIFPCDSCNKLLCSTCGDLPASALAEGQTKLLSCGNSIINRNCTTNTGSSTSIDRTSHDMEMTVAEVMERQERA